MFCSVLTHPNALRSIPKLITRASANRPPMRTHRPNTHRTEREYHRVDTEQRQRALRLCAVFLVFICCVVQSVHRPERGKLENISYLHITHIYRRKTGERALCNYGVSSDMFRHGYLCGTCVVERWSADGKEKSNKNNIEERYSV